MNPHILIVDDSSDLLRLMQIAFKTAEPQLRLATARSGQEALAVVNSGVDFRPKVLLMDLRMPGKSGIEVLKEMKSNPELKRIPVCIFSHGESPEDIHNCYDQGASCFFKKPTGLDELKEFATGFTNVWFKLACFA